MPPGRPAVTVGAASEMRGERRVSPTLQGGTMPKLSKDSAPNVQDAGRPSTAAATWTKPRSTS